MIRGIVTSHFVAAVLLIDLETPILSDVRQKLAGDSPQKLEFIPNQFRFRPLTPEDDRFDLDHHRQHELTQKVIVAIEQTNPAPNSPRSRFLQLLKAEDPNNSPHKQLEQAVVELTKRLKTNLDRSNSQRRATELKQLYDRAIQGRQAILQHPVLNALDETLPRGGLLFPVP